MNAALMSPLTLLNLRYDQRILARVLLVLLIALFPNLFVYFFAGATVFLDVGAQWVITKMDGSQASSMNRWGWGTGAGTAGITDTTLFTEASETRATATITRVTTAVSQDTYQADGTITATGAKTITNAMLFDAATAGNGLVKGDFTGVPLLTGDSIQFIGKVQAFR